MTPWYCRCHDTARIQQRTVTSVDGCWLWTISLDKDGYGNARLDRRSWRAHRLSWVTYRGLIPDGLVIDHLCRVRHCVNPAHMECVPPKVNTDRGELHLFRGVREREKTHCAQNHSLSGDNLRIRRKRNGGIQRVCATCADKVTRQWGRRAHERPTPQTAHGTPYGYRIYRCRCQACSEAERTYKRERREAQKAS